ncbi:ABC transporter permease [Corynebacterium anserum]|uniref:ABC transporter permease subunit n=1 Tax=Corynebacterium anserum TaxID=2684406 RepID=A0A7G7YLZ1_9CORY|nr:ABC transporter permease [Corynebacterium anserum]QNH95511.1 ABC transporter permease subunit [Corynebacterium anserum]
MNLVKSEWIKLSSTKGLWITSILTLIVSIGMAILMGFTAGLSLADSDIQKDPEAMVAIQGLANPENAFAGFITFGLMVIVIQAVMMVTNEYSNGVAKTTLLGTPKRWPVPLAKLTVYGVVAALLSFVSAVVSVPAMRWAMSWNSDDRALLENISLGADGIWKTVGLLTLYGVLCVMISIGVGYLIRNTAGAIAALLLWKLVVEGLVVTQIPKVKEWLPSYMPFLNMDRAVTGTEVADAPWGPTGSVLYFGLWCVVIFVVGVIILRKRDA